MAAERDPSWGPSSTLRRRALHGALLVLCVISAISARVAAHAAPPSVEAGNAAYNTGQFDAAIREYSAALESAGPSSSLLYNLGNAFYRTGRLPEAVLAYRRALVFDPYDQDVLYNLGLARERLPSAVRIAAAGTLVPQSVVRAVRLSLPPAQLELLGMAAYAGFWLCYALYYSAPSTAKRRAMNVLAIAVCWICFASWLLRESGTGATALAPTMPDTASTPVVVLAKNAAVHSGNSETFGIVFGLDAGSELLAGERRNEWIEVFLPSGARGWTKAAQVAEVGPTLDRLTDLNAAS